MKKWIRFLPLLLCIILCIIATQNFRLIVTHGSSMEPTYVSGELLLVSKHLRSPQPGDAVLIEHQGILMVKRVCAIAGQRAITPAIPSISGNIHPGTDPDTGTTTISVVPDTAELSVPEPLSQYWTSYMKSDYLTIHHYWSSHPSAVVPDGCIFVVGDNLADSFDSRNKEFGLIRKEQIKGYILCFK